MASARHSLRLPWIPVTFMFKDLLLALASTSVLMIGAAQAEESSGASLVLLTENFPPYNMAKNGKNFAKEENIEGIAVDIVRETLSVPAFPTTSPCVFLGSGSTNSPWKNPATAC